MNLLTTEQSDKLRKLYYEESLFKAYYPYLKACQTSVFRDTKISPTLVWYVAKQTCIELLSTSAPELEIMELRDKLIQFYDDIINPDHILTYQWVVPESQAYNSATLMTLSAVSDMIEYCGDDEMLPIVDPINEVMQKITEDIPWPFSLEDYESKIQKLMQEAENDESGEKWYDYTKLTMAEECILNPPLPQQSTEDLYQVLLFDFYDKHVKQIKYPFTAIGLWQKAREITQAIAQSNQQSITLLEQLTLLENELIGMINLPNGYHRLDVIEQFNAAKPLKIAAFKYDVTDIVELMLTASGVKGLILSTLKSLCERFLEESGKYADLLLCPKEIRGELRRLYLAGYTYDYTQSISSTPTVSTLSQEDNDVNKDGANEEGFFKVDENRTLDVCKSAFNEIIKSAKLTSGKQDVLRRLTSPSEGFYFNCSQYKHEDLALVLNKLQSKFEFTKSDVDAVYRDIAKTTPKS